jgi:hypothetical protein
MKNVALLRVGTTTLILCAMALAICTIAGCGFSYNSAAEKSLTSASSPIVSCSANPTSVITGTSTQISVKALSPEGLPLTYSYSATAGSLISKGKSATLDTLGVSGSITVTCKVADTAGNTASATTTLAVQATSSAPPTVSCLANPSAITEGGTVNITTEASSPEDRPLTYSWSASAGTIYGTDSDKATLFTTDVPPGTITVTCRVADDQGRTASATTNVTVTASASAPPTISCLANPSTVTPGGSVAITAVASSPEGRPLTYSWSASSGTISGIGNTATLNTTGAVAGTITVTCKVADNQGLTASATTTVTVNTSLPQPPTIGCSANPSTITLGSSVAITAVASSPEGRPLTYSWSASSGTISGIGNTATLNTTGAVAGTITVTCRVADDQGRTASATTNVTVTAPTSMSPTITCSANPSSITLDGSVAIASVASSPEGRPLTYSWSASSGTISGTGNTATLNTTGAAAGTITVICKVADNQGLTASATTTVTVNANVSPTIQPPQCAPAKITQPAPIVSTPVTPVLPTASTINVLLNGATGDGQTNDGPAIQSIIDNNPDGVIYFPLGQYMLDNPSLNQAGLVFSGFHGTAIMANGARFLCDNTTTSAGQCIHIVNSSGATFDNFRVGYIDEQNLPLARNDAISNAILVESSTLLNFGNTTVEASTGSGIWVTGSTNINFLDGTSVANTSADGLHFENVGNATLVGYTSQNTGDDGLSATNISTTTPYCGLNATNIQIYQSKSSGISNSGACGSSYSNFYIQDTANSGLGIGKDPTINSLVPQNTTFSNGTVVNAGRYPSTISTLKDCIDISLSDSTNVSNVVCSNPLLDGLYVFNGANHVTVSGVSVDAAANVGFQPTNSTNVSLSNTIARNSVNEGYSIQGVQTGSMVGAGTCSSGTYGFYHSAATDFTESNLMSFDSAENSSMHRVWWAENSSEALSVNGFAVLDDQTHPAPDVVGGAGDTSGSITIDGITQDLLGTTLTLQLP